MNKNLLIVGASTYGVVASEIAADTGGLEEVGVLNQYLGAAVKTIT